MKCPIALIGCNQKAMHVVNACSWTHVASWELATISKSDNWIPLNNLQSWQVFTCTVHTSPTLAQWKWSHSPSPELIPGPGIRHKGFNWSPRWLAEVLQHFLFNLSKPLELGIPYLEQLRPPSVNIHHSKPWSPHAPQCRHRTVMFRLQSGPRKSKTEKKIHQEEGSYKLFMPSRHKGRAFFYQLKELHRSYFTIWNSFYT